MEVTGFALNLSPSDSLELKKGNVSVLHDLNNYVFYDKRGRIFYRQNPQDSKWPTYRSWDAIMEERKEESVLTAVFHFLHVLAWFSPFTFFHQTSKWQSFREVLPSRLPGQTPRYLVVSKDFGSVDYQGIQIAGVRLALNKPKAKQLQVFAFREDAKSNMTEDQLSQYSLSQLSQEEKKEYEPVEKYLKWFAYQGLRWQLHSQDCIIHFFYHLLMGLNLTLRKKILTSSAQIPNKILQTYHVPSACSPCVEMKSLPPRRRSRSPSINSIGRSRSRSPSSD